MFRNMEICVIGAGASGLTASIKAALNHHTVTVLEKNNKVGKKLLLTGNGHCNYWNQDINLTHYNCEEQQELAKILQEKDKVLDFFNLLGIVPKIKNGYYYPYSNQASSIVNALYQMALNLKVKFIFDCEVIDIKKEKKFNLTTTKGNINADKVILATGSKASFKGDEKAGYRLATALGHSITPLLPALVQLVGSDCFYKDLEGIRSIAKLSLYENGKLRKEEVGEVQLTSYGLSGIVALNLSSIISKGLFNKKEEVISINFVPWFNKSPKDFSKWLKSQMANNPYLGIQEILDGFLNYKLTNLFLKKQKNNDINLEKLAEDICNFKVHITGTKDFLNAQVTQGGVPLKEINPRTMESNITKGLYLTGELLDVDGICGGYNLGFAWLTGLIAGENV